MSALMLTEAPHLAQVYSDSPAGMDLRGVLPEAAQRLLQAAYDESTRMIVLTAENGTLSLALSWAHRSGLTARTVK
mgnify:CR=1 FL=1